MKKTTGDDNCCPFNIPGKDGNDGYRPRGNGTGLDGPGDPKRPVGPGVEFKNAWVSPDEAAGWPRQARAFHSKSLRMRMKHSFGIGFSDISSSVG